MKCIKAREMYFASRDGVLDETKRLGLAEHLAVCRSCAAFVEEMEACLSLLSSLPALETSEGFEWNVKRRIHQERNRALAESKRIFTDGRRWFGWFAAGASLAAAVVLVIVSLATGFFGGTEPSVRAVPESKAFPPRSMVVSPGNGIFEPGIVSNFTAPRMVADRSVAFPSTSRSAEPNAFRFVATAREDSLMRENEILKKRIENLQRRIIYLQQALDSHNARTANFPLP